MRWTAPALGLGAFAAALIALALDRGRMHGDATLQWRAAGSALTPLSASRRG